MTQRATKTHGTRVIVGAAVVALALAFGGGIGAASAAGPAGSTASGTVVRDSGRVVVYYQKQFVDGSTGAYISPLPLVTENTGVDVVNLAAVHMNADELRLNDLLPDDPSFDTMWSELAEIQRSGVAVVGMIGGAQNATWQSLTDDYDVQYARLRDFVEAHALDGIDLDVETDTDISVVEKVIADLSADFGPSFLITLSPVTAALVGEDNLSGFDYDDLYRSSGDSIDWFNTQFYCGWGDPTAADYGEIVDYQSTKGAGIPASKIVIAALTNPDNCGDGWVPLDELTASIQEIKTTTPTFGGIAGWEYFNSLPGGTEAPWKWAAVMRAAIDEPLPTPTPTPTASPTTTPTAVPAPVPTATPTPASGVLAASVQDSPGLVAGGIIGAIAVLVGAVALAVAAFRRRASVERWALESRQPRD
jgi:chitinase